jgi:hypothetical protein
MAIRFENLDDLISKEEDACHLCLLQRNSYNQLNNVEVLKQLPLEVFVKKLLPLTGQQRGPLCELYFQARGYFDRKSKQKEDRGDLCKANKYYELKIAVLTSRDNRIFRGNQVRLYQSLEGYLFLTIYEDTGSYTLLYIPTKKLKEHYAKDISFSGAHIMGGSKNKMSKIQNGSKEEWSISLNRKKFDWFKYAITEKELFGEL